MEKIENFSLEEHEGEYETWPEKTNLIKDGKETGKQITGYVIEYQFKFENYYFLVTSYDCMFEEQCDFILLDDKYKTIARKTLFPWCSSWIVYSYEYIGNKEFIFTFIENYKLKVKLAPEKFFFWKRMNIKMNIGNL